MSRLNAKNLTAFVRRSTKAASSVPNKAELQSLLTQMTTEELQSYWLDFTSSRAYSVATTSIPDWRTRDQRDRLGYEILNYAFQPKEKGPDGKYIIIRSDLQEHIETYLLRHIDDERRLEQNFRAKPFFDRLHARIGMSVVIMVWLAIPAWICAVVISSVFHFDISSTLVRPAIFLFSAIWGAYLIMPLVRALLRICNL